ncbi:MAG: hypothetical protein LPK45_08725 [Bacteroidota bacterium]|nr:hypothetical protein [Bacteroidota bacterium]MDX5431168.1 hypothetical protein [Bacteroidota bacterium]MDX5469907.1 hypothetical protein [Bacteroidota bacterium]
MNKLILSVLFLSLIGFTSCNKDKDQGPSHTFTISMGNQTINNNQCKRRQLTRIAMVPADGSPNSREVSFVLNPSESGTFTFALAQLGSYHISVFTNEGHSVTWKNFAVSDGGSVVGYVSANSDDYAISSRLASLSPTESDIPCN